MEKFYLLVALLALGGSCLGDEVNENDTDSGVYSYTTNFFTVPVSSILGKIFQNYFKNY